MKGLPEAGKSSRVNWTVNEVSSTGTEATITLQEGSNTIIANFVDKTIPTLPTLNSSATYTYSGSALMPVVETEALTGWNILVNSGDLVIDNPTDAGTYTVYVTRDEDEEYAAVNQAIGTYEIKPKELTSSELSVTGATAILKGQALSASELTGSAPVAGTFAWTAPATIAEGASAEATASNPYPVVFTPANLNYVVASSVALTQIVPFYTVSADAIRTITITQNNANGTVVVKVNGTEVSNGAQVTEGNQVEVVATPNDGYTSSISTTGITNGIVDASGEVKVSVTFSPTNVPGEEEPDPTTPDTPEEPEKPTVTPPVVTERTPTTAVITWDKVEGATAYKLFLYAKKGDTTPLMTYEFDANGQLKASAISFNLTGLEEGKSYYVKTVAYKGEEVLMEQAIALSTTPTAIERIADAVQITTTKGMIHVNLATPLSVRVVSMSGLTLYEQADAVGSVEIPVGNAGVYAVILYKGHEVLLQKVIVR